MKKSVLEKIRFLAITRKSFSLKIKKIAMALSAIFVFWTFAPDSNPKPEKILPAGQELIKKVQELTFSNDQIPTQASQATPIARLGRKLFFDKRLSANEKISCASCHNPQTNFTDRTPKAMGIGPTLRRTPSIVNVFANSWFFWDGRTDSLAAQALGPIEHPNEHGVSRLFVVHFLRTHYLDEYEQIFGPMPNALLSTDLPLHAIPSPNRLHLPINISAYGLASLSVFSIMDDILVASRQQQIAPGRELSNRASLAAHYPKEWVDNWNKLPASTQNAINEVFANFGKSIASYEAGLIAVDSPFDRFAKKLLANSPDTPESSALDESFGPSELHGLKLFTGPAKCITCHNGANFTDQQFHNIGLDANKLDLKHFIDTGRALGVILVQDSLFNCLGSFFSNQELESCKELPWLDTENLELVGAFKTPSLRNAKERPPYMHDGRFKNLSEVIEHYNSADATPYIGHREETLAPLHLDEKEKKALIDFLKSLSAPVIDLTN